MKLDPGVSLLQYTVQTMQECWPSNMYHDDVNNIILLMTNVFLVATIATFHANVILFSNQEGLHFLASFNSMAVSQDTFLSIYVFHFPPSFLVT